MRKDLTGNRFGRLTVLSVHHRLHPQTWRCRCDCGVATTVLRRDLQQGRTRSCGCLRREASRARALKHGHVPEVAGIRTPSPTYNSWQAMIQRCHNPNSYKYPEYGQRGIIVCRRWRKFVNFLADMGERPKGTTLDRKDSTKGYFKENCRWATSKQQTKNRRPWGSLKEKAAAPAAAS